MILAFINNHHGDGPTNAHPAVGVVIAVIIATVLIAGPLLKIKQRPGEEAMNRNTQILLFVGMAVFIFIALTAAIIAAAFYFHIFRIANVVNGG